MMELNFTLLIQLVNFLITLVVLNWLIISPIRKIIGVRRSKLEGLDADASSFAGQAAEKMDNYSATLAAARACAAAAREAMRASGLEREASLLTSAYEQAEAMLAQRRKEIFDATDAAERGLRAQVPALAIKAAERVLAQ